MSEMMTGSNPETSGPVETLRENAAETIDESQDQPNLI
jgi:hypothetical protein